MPSKRDFVALNAPRKFLNPFETWLQSGIASSKDSLGTAWQDLFLQAPIWRFWMGRNVCDTSVAGVMMPSVDGVGRYFPLCAFAVISDESEIISPLHDTMDDWYEAAENLLLTTLEEDYSETPEQLVAKMELPSTAPLGDSDGDTSFAIPGGVFLAPAPHRSIDAVFTTMAQNEVQKTINSLTFWWTIGGAEDGAHAMVFEGMPDVTNFSAFLDSQILNENKK